MIIDSHLTRDKTDIASVMSELTDLLLEKNRQYGNSAIEPVRIFSHADAGEQIKVRIDDKISRIVSGQVDDQEDVYIDLIGYLVLLLVYIRNEN